MEAASHDTVGGTNQLPSSDFFDRLTTHLEKSQSWPGSYVFKFIVPAESLTTLVDLLPQGHLSQRPSKNGRYMAVNLTVSLVEIADVIRTYQKVAVIPGMISL